MRSFLFGSAVLATLVLAAPAPQDIEFDLADSIPSPSYTTTLSTVTYNPTAILESALPQITASLTTTATNATITDAPVSDDDDDSDASVTDSNQKVKRTACAPNQTGAGPVPTVDTPSAFLALPAFAAAASAASVPPGYYQTFSNLNASNNA